MARSSPPTVIVQPSDSGGGGMHPVAFILLLGAIALGVLLLLGALRPAPEPEPAAVTPPPPTVIEQANAEAIRKRIEMEMIERTFAVEREKAWAQQMDIALAFAANFALGIGLGALLVGTALALLRILFGPELRRRLPARRHAAAAQGQPSTAPPPEPQPAAPPAQQPTVTIYVSGNGDQPGQAAPVKHRRPPVH